MNPNCSTSASALAVRSAAFEALERRQLMASGSWAPLNIPCTANNDVVLIKQQGDFLKVTTNGVQTTHRWKSISIPGSTPGSQVIIPGINKIVVDGGFGADCILADATVTVPMEVKGGAGNDLISTGNGNDTVYGGANALQNVYESGSDTIVARGGNDKVFSPKYGFASFNTGDGKDTVTGGSLNDHIDTGAQDDSIACGLGDDYVNAGEGNDSVIGDLGNDTINGNGGNDTLNGGTGFDSMNGGAGHDSLMGDNVGDTYFSDPDTIKGGEGWDTIDGGGGNDKLYGEGGRDWFMHSRDADSYNGGPDLDSLDYRAETQPIRVKLTTSTNGSNGNGRSGEGDFINNDVEAVWGGSGNDTLEGSNNVDTIFGMGGNDSIRGYNGDDSLNGGEGHDTVFGDAGMDNMYGESGNDELLGGADSDYMYGGDHADIIVGIGGGQADGCYGMGGSDSIWMDLTQWETSDADSSEKSAGKLHVVNVFLNGVSKDAVAPEIADPGYDSYAKGYAKIFNHGLFSPDGITRFDVNQGLVGNCGFVAGLASIADKKPWRIEQAIVDLRDGTYAVRIRHLGTEHFVRIDNDLPIRKKGTTKLAYARLGQDGAMWAPLLEKVEATLMGGYGVLTGIWPTVAYRRFGGNAWEHWAGEDDILNDMSAALNAGQMVTAWTGSFDLDTTKAILPTHAYEVVQVDKVKKKILVYNPWGTDTDGNFVQGEDDGMIWLSLSSFHDKFINAAFST